MRILELYLNVHLWVKKKNVFNGQTLIFLLCYISYLAASLLFNWPFERQLPPPCTWSWRGSLFQDNTHLPSFSERGIHHPGAGLCFILCFPQGPAKARSAPWDFLTSAYPFLHSASIMLIIHTNYLPLRAYCLCQDSPSDLSALFSNSVIIPDVKDLSSAFLYLHHSSWHPEYNSHTQHVSSLWCDGKVWVWPQFRKPCWPSCKCDGHQVDFNSFQWGFSG